MSRTMCVLAVIMACFAAEVACVTDQEFKDLTEIVHNLGNENERKITELSKAVRDLQEENKQQATLIAKLLSEEKSDFQDESLKNATIEERVALLEIQVVEIEEDVTILTENDDFLFDEQVIQDERLLNLEVASDETEDIVETLQVTTAQLDFRVTVLEENEGSNGNGSISELEQRVETLEGITAQQETRIIGLQVTDVSLDARVTELEENGGGSGSNVNIAFDAVVTTGDTITVGSTVLFNEVLVNEGNGYNATTGVFTVPSGGNGSYYFSMYMRVDTGEFALFGIEVNDDTVCYGTGEMNNIPGGTPDTQQATCSAVANIAEGDEVKVVYASGSDTTPLYPPSTIYIYHGFVGFKI